MILQVSIVNTHMGEWREREIRNTLKSIWILGFGDWQYGSAEKGIWQQVENLC